MTGGLTLAWLLVAHLVADFVLQTDAIALGKTSAGSRIRAFALHTCVVAFCLVPFVVAFGWPGFWALLAIAAAHVVIDAAKAALTLRANAIAVAAARGAHEPAESPAMLGTGWTAAPAILFALDQAAHVVAIVWVWWIWLHAAAPATWFADAVRGAFGGGSVDLHRFSVAIAVGTALIIVNTRAAALFVALLLRPERATSPEPPVAPPPAPPQAQPPAWELRLGPLTGRAAPEPPPPPRPRVAPPGRIGEAVGILERLLIVVLILGAADLAIGLVVAAKTLARFKQLEDREFAEYYLLGTLASVTIGVASAFVGRAALGM